MDIGDIIKEYLVKNGYDGLCGDGCGCDGSCPCVGDGIPLDCEPAYKHIATKEELENPDWEYDGEIGDVYYSTKKGG